MGAGTLNNNFIHRTLQYSIRKGLIKRETQYTDLLNILSCSNRIKISISKAGLDFKSRSHFKLFKLTNDSVKKTALLRGFYKSVKPLNCINITNPVVGLKTIANADLFVDIIEMALNGMLAHLQHLGNIQISSAIFNQF